MIDASLCQKEENVKLKQDTTFEEVYFNYTSCGKTWYVKYQGIMKSNLSAVIVIKV